MAISVGGAVKVNITGIFDRIGFPFFSNNLIHDRRESLDEVPEIIMKIHGSVRM